ncbi:hypothetical protein GCM10027589_15530 [Actinocorallia lasiicapitis]
MHRPEPETVTVERLREEWPDWHIRRSGEKQFWKATRVTAGSRLGCTLIEDDGPRLLAALRHQVEVDARNEIRLPITQGW